MQFDIARVRALEGQLETAKLRRGRERPPRPCRTGPSVGRHTEMLCKVVENAVVGRLVPSSASQPDGLGERDRERHVDRVSGDLPDGMRLALGVSLRRVDTQKQCQTATQDCMAVHLGAASSERASSDKVMAARLRRYRMFAVRTRANASFL